MRNLLSALFIVDELPQLDYVPWREAAASALKFADELIVVHGGKPAGPGRAGVLEHFAALNDSRVRCVTLPWAADADWTQIGRSGAYGQLHASGEWFFRVLIDEVFPDEFSSVRADLARLPAHIALVSVHRYYLLGMRDAFPYRRKPLFIRRGSGFTYGRINPEQGSEAMPLLFDDPVDARRWYAQGRVVQRATPDWIEMPGAEQRLQAGETPTGYRDLSGEREAVLEVGFLNTDVNYLPDELIVQQKLASAQGYARLPDGYRRLPEFTPDTALQFVERKIRRMATSGRLVRVTPPEALLAFADRQDPVHNIVRRVCAGECGLPWNRVTRAGR